MSEVAIAVGNDLRSTFARGLSWIFLPPNVSLFIFTLLTLRLNPSNRGLIWFFSFIFATALPLLFMGWLRLTNKINHSTAPVKEERTLPYLFGVFFYACGAVSLWYWQAPPILWALMICYSFNTAITLFINLRWKISVHMIGISGPLAILPMVFGWWGVPFYVLIPLVGWARLRLQVHTLSQVIAGTVFGYFATLLEMWLILYYIKFS